MQSVNIELNAKVSTDDQNLIKSDPDFNKKNSLVYKGVLSNLKKDSGDGFLTTTGHNITIDQDNKAIKVDGDAFINYSDDIKVITETTNTTAMNGILSANSKHQIHKVDTTIYFDNELTVDVSNTVSAGGTFLDNSETKWVIAKTQKSDEGVYTTYIYLYEDTTFLKEYSFETGTNINLSCQKMSGCYLSSSDRWIIGFDADDYRQRGTALIIYNEDKYMLSIGFGCVDSTGLATGEPIITARNRTQTTDYTDNYDVVWNADGGLFKAFTYYADGKPAFSKWTVASGPDITASRYSVLDNGVIRFWTGYYNEDTYKDDILSQNADLGTSPTTNTGSQSNEDKWDVMKHRQCNVKVTTSEAPATSTSYNYSGTGTGITYGICAFWLYAIDFSTDYSSGANYGNPKYINYVDLSYDNFAIDDYKYACVPEWINFIDYSVMAGKLSKTVTDSDVIFPRMNVFFNLASNRGKYWDYGKGWCRFFKSSVAVMKVGKEVAVLAKPLEIVDFNSKSVTSAYFDSKEKEYPSDWTGLNTEDVAKGLDFIQNDYNSNYKIVEPCKNWRPLYASIYNHLYFNSDTVYMATEKKPAYDDSATVTADATIHFDRWFFKAPFNNAEQTRVNYTRFPDCTNQPESWQYNDKYCYMFKKHKIVGGGEDFEDWAYNFGGNNDDSILEAIPFSVELSNGLQSLIYSGIQSGLAYDKTLLFTPAEIDDKYWVSTDSDSDEVKVTIWNDSEVNSVTIGSGDIKVEKLTDYLFRTNVLNKQNLIVESHEGVLRTERGFIPYNMEHSVGGIFGLNMALPEDGDVSNNTYYLAAGYNVNLSDNVTATSFLLPSITINGYTNSSDTSDLSDYILINKHPPFIPVMAKAFNSDEAIDSYYTYTLASTDNTYKETRTIPVGATSTKELSFGKSSYDISKENTSWWADSSTTIYPVAIASGVSGINYITSTIDLPDNYSVRFYTQNNKVFAAFNNVNAIYYGSQIFTVMGGNYYFDGQGIYYLGTGTDYSQNTFIAYALGMKFIANSSSEAYFYSPFDKCIYLFTSSNTLQKAESLSCMGNILDAVYCPINQTLYILFDSNQLLVKTQDDSCIIEVTGTSLQSTNSGVQVINDTDNTYVIHGFENHSELMDLNVQTEWLGNPFTLFKYSWADVVFYNDNPTENVNVNVTFEALNGTEIKSITNKVTIKKSDWQNQLYRVRITPPENIGNAFRITVQSDDNISIYTINCMMDKCSDMVGAPIKGRI